MGQAEDTAWIIERGRLDHRVPDAVRSTMC